MMRGIIKQVEGAIALSIFLLYLVFYFSSIKYAYFDYSEKIAEIDYYKNLVDFYLNNISKEYILVSIEVKIPKAVKDYFCNINNPDIKRDFCERFPIYYPLNLSFLTNYTGVINNTFDSFYNEEGIFFYANFSEFKCENKNYVLVKIYNPNNIDLENYQVFITSPTIREWLRKGVHLKVNDSKIIFCYHHKNFICDYNPKDAYGIWIKIPLLKRRSSLLLKISLSFTANSNQEKTGIDVFDFYDNFEYKDLDEFTDNWKLKNVECYKISNTEWQCNGTAIFDSISIESKKGLGRGNYIIYFKIKKNCGILFCDDKIKLGNNCEFNYSKGFSFLVCKNVPQNSKIRIEAGGLYNYLNSTIDYIVVKKLAAIEPFIEILEEPYCKKDYKLIIGPYIKYKYAKDLDKFPIQNAYLQYIENIEKSVGLITSEANYLGDKKSGIDYFKLLFYIDESLENNGEYHKNVSIAIFNKFKNTLGDFYITLRKILFSKSRWFVVDLETIYKGSSVKNVTSSLFHWENELLPGYHNYQVYFYFLTETNSYIDVYNNFKIPANVFLNYSLPFAAFKDIDNGLSLLFFFSKPVQNSLIYESDGWFLYYKRLYPIYFDSFSPNDYRNILIYTYAYNDTSIPLKDFQFYFRIPKVEIKGIREIKAISIDYINPKGFNISFEKFGNYGDLKNYKYFEKRKVWIFKDNKLVEDYAIIYV